MELFVLLILLNNCFWSYSPLQIQVLHLPLRQAYQYDTGNWIVYLLNIIINCLLRDYLAFHKFNIICLWETYLNSSNAPDDDTLWISGYNFVHSDQPFNSECEGIHIYYKNYLPLWIISVNYLSECINFKIMINSIQVP